MKNMVRISKKFEFEAAHALEGYDGLCKNIHGHSYQFTITLKGEVIDDPSLSSHGMVMDFKDLKRIVCEQVTDKFDHALILREDSKYIETSSAQERIIIVPYQPTCENMIVDFLNRIQVKLPQGVVLVKAYLQETNNSYCEWFLEDNN
jgi:6-pyruvoyltetrahydropterin/6-carboxytetrahydropterin synthase